MVRDHDEIEQLRLPERYLSGQLDPELSAAFSEHALECEECWDRLQLAQIWREHEQVKHEPRLRTQFDFEDAADFQQIHIVGPSSELEDADPAQTGWETPEPDSPGSPAGQASGSNAQLPALAPLSVLGKIRFWQIPTLTTLAAVLAVALEYIHQQQMEIMQQQSEITRLQRDSQELRLSPVARFVVQFEPWHLLLLGAIATLLPLLIFATYFTYELHK